MDIETIYELWVNKVYQFFYYKTLSKEISEDLTSETFLAYAKKVSEGITIDNPKAFLFGITKNTFLRYLKSKYTQQEVSFSEMIEIKEEELIESTTNVELSEMVHRFVEMLPEKQKIIMQMRLIEKLSFKEICQKLGKDENYVKTTQKRAIKKLKELLECTPSVTT